MVGEGDAQMFSKLTEEGSPLLFRAKGGRWGHILKYLGKGKLRIGGKEFPGLTHVGPAAQVDPARSSTGVLEVRGDSILRLWKL
jgi:hypothetical protein